MQGEPWKIEIEEFFLCLRDKDLNQGHANASHAAYFSVLKWAVSMRAIIRKYLKLSITLSVYERECNNYHYQTIFPSPPNQKAWYIRNTETIFI